MTTRALCIFLGVLADATGGANAGADDSVASMEKNAAQLEDKIKQLHGRAHWINDHLPESKQDAAWSANTKELDAEKAKLKAEKEKLADAQKAVVDAYMLAAAAGGADAAAANPLASRAVLVGRKGFGMNRW